MPWYSKVRSFTIRKAPALPSRGHALFISLYVITNIILMFAHADYNNMPIMSNLASRTGWSVFLLENNREQC